MYRKKKSPAPISRLNTAVQQEYSSKTTRRCDHTCLASGEEHAQQAHFCRQQLPVLARSGTRTTAPIEKLNFVGFFSREIKCFLKRLCDDPLLTEKTTRLMEGCSSSLVSKPPRSLHLVNSNDQGRDECADRRLQWLSKHYEISSISSVLPTLDGSM